MDGAEADHGRTDPATLATAIRRDLARLADRAGAAAAGDLRAALAALARIEAAALTIVGRPGPAGGAAPAAEEAGREVLDPQPLRRLLHLAGAQDGAELLRRLDQDLDAAARRLRAAIPGGPAAEIRAATHVLVSLAGSVGGRATEARARALNAAIHDGARPEDLAAEGEALLEAIAALRAALSEPGGPGGNGGLSGP
jgi:hypothetical protein